MRFPSLPSHALFALLVLAGCTVYEPSQAVPCLDGTASGFTCSNIDLAAHLPPATLGGARTNDVWGWTDPESGAELALAGMTSGLTIVDATPWSRCSGSPRASSPRTATTTASTPRTT